MRIGYFLSSEEHPPEELVRQARLAADAGFEALWISDHYHPWNHEQGQSPFVWSVIGAVSQVCDLPITTAVTCPTVRIHPAVIAQAAATSARMCRGGFRLGVGSGEALNEHVTGSRWPTADVRLEMLEEAVGVIRRLLSGERVSHHGRHYTVEDARIFTLPDDPVEIPVSGFGPEAIALAARIGDGFVTTQPDQDALAAYREQGGTGPAMAGAKACWGPDRDQAQALAHRLWANAGVPGELAQVLPSPAHFEQASQLVTPEMVGETMPCGPDVEEHVTKLAAYAEAGFDELYVAQIGPDQDDFFRVYEAEVLPALRRSAT
ncbi:TIGR03557 family F420-dependent LLM class oxidoreductase [Nocardioides sp.]|uniref:TIGR03557 family F420-dependent LLM class oxidoreductase n=1 Tax=Nocardioides sp. TaxID=35761 RepID=UPI002EDA32FB